MTTTSKSPGQCPRVGRKPNSKPNSKSNSKSRAVPVPRIFQGLPNQPLTHNQETELKGMVALASADEVLIQNRIQSICPKGSILEVIADIFRRTTDIPLELPICMVMSFISAMLVSGSAGMMVCGKHVDPFLWMILLSESGNGKTYTEQFISSFIKVMMFPQVNSAAKFVEELSSKNRSLWLQDEFAQLLKRIQANQNMADMREYILRVYDKSDVVRNTLKSTIEIPDPVLTILGMTVSSTFADSVSSEMMLDGFMQRLQFVYADNDPARPMSDYPYYRATDKQWSNRFARAWKQIAAINIQGMYRLGSGATDEYTKRFRELADHFGGVLPGSFFRRILWNANKLALVYHVILGKSSKIVDREDMKWAMNMTLVHLQDLRRLVNSYGASELAELVDRGEGIRDRFKEKWGRPISRREFTAYLKGVDNHGLMSFIMSVLNIK